MIFPTDQEARRARLEEEEAARRLRIIPLMEQEVEREYNLLRRARIMSYVMPVVFVLATVGLCTVVSLLIRLARSLL